MSLAVALWAALSAVEPPELGPADTAEVGVVEEREVDPTVFPDPNKFSRGFFVEAGSGPSIPIGASAAVLSPGAALGARTGYEIRRWVALQAQAMAILSHYDDGVLGDELLQQYTYMGQARFGIPIRRFVILLYGGAGLHQVNSNLLQIAGIVPDSGRLGFAYEGGLGLDVHTLSRHFSGGLLASFMGSPRLGAGGAVGVSLYLRYTR